MDTSLSFLITSYLEHLEIEKGRSPHTIRNYDLYLRTFLSWMQQTCGTQSAITPADITTELVRKFRLHLSRRQTDRGTFLNQSTQNYYIIALRNFLRYLHKQDIATLAPEKIELARQVRPQVAVLSLDKLELLLKAAKPQDPNNLSALRDYAMLEILFSTGLRVSELTSLNRDKVNTKTREFVVRGKGNKDRVVFLSQSAARALDDYLKKRADDTQPLFINHRVQSDTDDTKGEALRLTTRSVQRLMQKYARRAGIVEKITPHTLRHTFATDLLQSGADLRSVQELLGHANVQTTQVYTHVTNKQLKEVHEAFHARRRKRTSD
ncbi:MAG TPA: tyrosine-type recombinase/integrase [bacterium]|nr:tyrosine-type recombinase/integrase [bacterium]